MKIDRDALLVLITTWLVAGIFVLVFQIQKGSEEKKMERDGFNDVDASKAIPIGEGQQEGFFIPKGHVLVFCFGLGADVQIVVADKVGYANGTLAAPVGFIKRGDGPWHAEHVQRVENLTVVGHALISYTMPAPKWWDNRDKLK